MPDLLESLAASLEAYRHQHGAAFMYDGLHYQVSVYYCSVLMTIVCLLRLELYQVSH